MNKPTRREERELAFVLIFENSVTGETFDEIINNASESRDLELGKFSEKLFKGTLNNREEIDEIINNNLTKWNISRLSKVILSCLRLGVYEIIKEETPDQIVANEVVEIAKKYGDADDYKFINGVLASVIRNK